MIVERGQAAAADLRAEVSGEGVTDASEARHSSKLYGPKYGPSSPVKPSNVGDPLTLGEQAVFELPPADA